MFESSDFNDPALAAEPFHRAPDQQHIEDHRQQRRGRIAAAFGKGDDAGARLQAVLFGIGLAGQQQAADLDAGTGAAGNGAPARDYLAKRGISEATRKAFGFGLAPDSRTQLKEALKKFPTAMLVESGMLISVDDKDPYDRFRGRLMIPIKDARGRVIAFGGRILDAGEPKYLNSPETPLFSKGNTLYGLFEARQAIRDKGYVIVCEGYMDVVALAQLGFANGVATLGTACTANHVRALMRQTDRIIFSFDGDAAGQRAAKRALEACLPMMADDKEIKFLFLPTEHDPDSFVRERGAPAFEEAIRKISEDILLETVSGW